MQGEMHRLDMKSQGKWPRKSRYDKKTEGKSSVNISEKTETGRGVRFLQEKMTPIDDNLRRKLKYKTKSERFVRECSQKSR